VRKDDKGKNIQVVYTEGRKIQAKAGMSKGGTVGGLSITSSLCLHFFF
jgi:hypothetical protein